MDNKKDDIAIVRPFGDIGEINGLAALLSEQKNSGNLFGYSFLLPTDSSITPGDFAGEINRVYRNHLDNNTHDVTQEVLAGVS